VLTSFLALASLVLVVKSAGGDAFWGMQFQDPKFLIAMTTLVLLVALNLFGVFEVYLAGGTMSAASNLASKEGGAGAFFNGVLATLLATPCTAPFLGLSIGYALAQPGWVIVLFFLTVGVGLALPYVLLCMQPAWLKWLPKPGNWMVKFKVAMGFPMLATAVWLTSVTTAHFSNDVFWLGMFLVVLGLAAWLFGEFIQRGSKNRSMAWAAVVGLLVMAYGWFLEKELHWRNPSSGAASKAVAKTGPIAWEAWSPAAVDTYRSQRRPVLVDFTASWCTTCQINKRRAIEVDSVAQRIRDLKVAPLLGDFSLKDPLIAAELRRFQRAGVPLVLVYPADPGRSPIVLPDGLFSAATLIEALNSAAK
jgi:thiol:disulfide interchange protein